MTGCLAEIGLDQASDDETIAGPQIERLISGPPVQGPSTAGDMPELYPGLDDQPAGRLATFEQLAQPPTLMHNQWLDDVTANAFTTPAVMRSRMQAAFDATSAFTQAEQPDLEGLRIALEQFEALPNLTPGPTPTRVSLGYTPERARWLSAESVGGEVSTRTMPGQYGELRRRALRTYCAAKNAHAADTQQSMMTDHVAAFNILGAKVGLLPHEAILSLAEPERVDSDSVDGAEAFVLPFGAGARFGLVSFLPWLPEVRSPIAYLTADGEVANQANVSGDSYQEWQTITHADGFSGVTQNWGTLSKHFKLFEFFVFDVGLNPELTLETAACSEGRTHAACRDQPLAQVGRLLRGTQAGPNGPVLGLSAPGRAGGWTIPGLTGAGRFNDGPWVLDIVNFRATPEGVSRDNMINVRYPDPMAARTLQNNDKAFDQYTTVGGKLGLNVGLSVPGLDSDTPGCVMLAHVLQLCMVAEGHVRTDLSVVHSFRERQEAMMVPFDGEFPAARPRSLTAFTVTPKTTGSVGFNTNGRLSIALRLPIFGVFEQNLQLWKEQTKPVETGRTVFPEANRMRLNTAIDGEDGSLSLATTSHWPQSGDFTTHDQFGECLVVNEGPRQLPPACSSAPPSPDAPQPEDLKVGLCTYIPELHDLDVPEEQVQAEKLCREILDVAWYDTGVTKGQFHPSHRNLWVKARVMDPNRQDEITALGNALTTCGQVYQAAGRDPAEAHPLLNFAACTADGTIHTEDVFSVEPIAGTTPPPQAPACHAN